MAQFSYRSSTVGPGYSILDGDEEVDWKATRDEASARVEELEASHGAAARKAQEDEFFRSVGLDPNNLPPPPSAEEAAQRQREAKEQGDQASGRPFRMEVNPGDMRVPTPRKRFRFGSDDGRKGT